ncbi:hypothetical protein [Hymenobacter wooponensis]|uniref:Uncharacterized protein n=1 Tax=Hymenobacter wooponensis TaxID=1525360 RepID=A0A4Z0MJP2_9BACT|nr:hypothetical protein [Hymenobacter wooponensis]TGD79679.1 hypothetical protein EU557_15790 [Hymenobacter wooponensis]
MKTSLLSAVALIFTASSAFAAPAFPNHDNKPKYGTDRNSNYGYDKNHRVTPAEKARWEAAQRTARRDDYRDDRRDDRRDNRDYGRNDREFDRNDRDFNYGYAKNHRVTGAERARWEAAHRNDRRR